MVDRTRTGTRTRRVRIVVVGGGGGVVGERLSSGGTADGDEDLVGDESEVGIGELGGELAEWRWEMGGCEGSGSGGGGDEFGRH